MSTFRKIAVSQPYLNIFEHSFFPLVVRYQHYLHTKIHGNIFKDCVVNLKSVLVPFFFDSVLRLLLFNTCTVLQLTGKLRLLPALYSYCIRKTQPGYPGFSFSKIRNLDFHGLGLCQCSLCAFLV